MGASNNVSYPTISFFLRYSECRRSSRCARNGDSIEPHFARSKRDMVAASQPQWIRGCLQRALFTHRGWQSGLHILY